MDSADGDGRELILRTATRLFAALGYDSSSVVQVAEAAGVSQEKLAAHFATKRELYLAVMEQSRHLLAEAITPRVDALMAAPVERRARALHDFIDGYLDFCVDHPEMPALWMHRWLSDASDIVDLEAENAQPLTQYVVEGVDTLAEPAGMDPLHTTYTMIYCIHGFVLGGVLGGGGHRCGAEDQRQLRRFRAHLHQLLGRALGLPDERAEEPAPSR
ncbi:TetR/AcrR family transcriptional regulator [Nonomuraea gerenzanensis]|uniref:Homeodomain-like n=1 Tax=Nonomuraea gerenzanensis TaxID=93944 RepID=A0A1M4EI10_9ACTN|nr:TetR/AcrR family transcriptional regulator [Nonomuraea gerenzanensis]UBU10204.1 TetR/AcrR family transcriptional regulator [Nonomuraea gerenzanensis]SBO98581.1 Homeodomain-like [Nonomuraea gerenzanensis]